MKVRFEIPNLEDLGDLIKILGFHGYPVVRDTVYEENRISRYQRRYYAVVDVPEEETEQEGE